MHNTQGFHPDPYETARPGAFVQTRLAGAKKETEEYSPISKKRASEGTRTHTHEGTRS